MFRFTSIPEEPAGQAGGMGDKPMRRREVRIDGLSETSEFRGGDINNGAEVRLLLDKISVDVDKISGALSDKQLDTEAIKGVTATNVEFVHDGGTKGLVYKFDVAPDAERTAPTRSKTETTEFAVKIQRFTPGTGKETEALGALQRLEKFSGCGVIAFRAWNKLIRGGSIRVIVTVMEKASSDLYDVVDEERFQESDNLNRLIKFLYTFWVCLNEGNTSYVDMKPENIGVFKDGSRYTFRVIDIDSLGTTTHTEGFTHTKDPVDFETKLHTIFDLDVRSEYMRKVGLFGMLVTIAMCCKGIDIYNETSVGKGLDPADILDYGEAGARLKAIKAAIETRRGDFDDDSKRYIDEMVRIAESEIA